MEGVVDEPCQRAGAVTPAAWILVPHLFASVGKNEAFTIVGLTGPEKRRPTFGV